MHSKTKGNIGEAQAIVELTKLGFNIFKELGDLSKIDLIAEKDGQLIRIQCKGVTPKNGALELTLKKSGPNYSFKYQENQFDFFAVCNLETYEIYWIPASVLQTHSSLFSLRLNPSKNNQKYNVNSAADYKELNLAP